MFPGRAGINHVQLLALTSDERVYLGAYNLQKSQDQSGFTNAISQPRSELQPPTLTQKADNWLLLRKLYSFTFGEFDRRTYHGP